MKDGEGLDAIVTFNPSSHCYLTGYQTLELTHQRCLIVPAEGELVHVTSDFEEPGVHLSSTVKKTATYSFLEEDGFAQIIRRILADMCGKKQGRVGAELDSGWVLPPSRWLRLPKELGGMKLIDCTGILRQLKLVKSPAEIDCFRQSCRISSDGMATAVDTAAEGRTDNEVAAEAARRMVSAGSEYMCIPPVVTTGRRSGVPHSTHKRVPIRVGDVIFIELGACINRYSGPLMRTVVIGTPTAEVRRNSESLVEVLNEVIDLIRPGETCASISRKVRRRRPVGTNIISPALIEHDYGYNLDIGFPPNWSEGGPLISPKDETVLEPGMVFHLNETLRHVYRYGICSSETVVVTGGGCEVLTDFERRLIVK
jgi:Xaa-Pro aminopeptidase